ncbi:MAG: hypothetical protein FADNKDHG_01318 [Holosporales bacterium]
MKKKTFVEKGGFKSLLDDTYSDKKKTDIDNINKPETFKKVTFRLKLEIVTAVKEIAYVNRISVTELIERALVEKIEREKKQ